MSALLDWLDNRTGYREFVHEALYERIPGGSRWRYVWGSTLVFAFVTQMITGFFLWMAYSPSSQTAWESVYFIQHQMQLGWFVRGVHHFMAQAMVVLLGLHLLQVVVDGAYKAPREINFWLGLVLMKIVLGLSLTGYLLPWDQKGYWATQVATKIAGIVPLMGMEMQRVVVGGTEYGHHTLTRFFALHAGLLPAALVFFLVLHVALFRRHGITAKNPTRRPDEAFWPDQVLKDAVACLAVLATVVFLTIYLGADLGAPADPANAYSAARPEWYFLFLFQFLKFFPGETEVIGAVVIPGLVMLVLFLMPLLARRRVGELFNVGFILVLLVGAGVLTFQAIREDRRDQNYLDAVRLAHEQSVRAQQLAARGIAPEGAARMVRNDSKLQGPALFKTHCASCHSHADAQGNGIVAKESSAPNLYGFGRTAWIEQFLDANKIATPIFFGNTAHKEGEMVDWVKSNPDSLTPENRAAIAAALAAEAGISSVPPPAADLVAKGKELIATGVGCTDCHKFHDTGDLGTAPDLTGYGSREWLIAMISNPGHARFYADKNDRMPSFADPVDPEKNRLSARQIEMIVEWLRGEWYEPPADNDAQPAEPQAQPADHVAQP